MRHIWSQYAEVETQVTYLMEVEFSEGSTLNLAQFPGHGTSLWK